MIYFLEDDNNIRNFVIYALNNTGLSATGFGTPGEFWEAMKREKPELLLLDIHASGRRRDLHFKEASQQKRH